MDLTEQAIRKRLQVYATQAEGRDQLIRDAHAAGFTKTAIHRITGIARTTIDRIVGTVPAPQTSRPGTGTPPSSGPGPAPANRPEG